MKNKKKKVLSKEEFEYFKKWHDFYLKKFNQLQWNCIYLLEEVEKCYAKTFYNLANKTATIYLNPNYKIVGEFTLINLKRTAKHEVQHLITARIYMLAQTRFINNEEVNEAEEELVRLLDKLLPL